MKFGCRRIEWSATATTGIGARDKKIIVFTRARSFGTFVQNNIFFLRSKWVELHTNKRELLVV
jgi:hypothetical protein